MTKALSSLTLSPRQIPSSLFVLFPYVGGLESISILMWLLWLAKPEPGSPRETFPVNRHPAKGLALYKHYADNNPSSRAVLPT